jgi:hypothetical protein
VTIDAKKATVCSDLSKISGNSHYPSISFEAARLPHPRAHIPLSGWFAERTWSRHDDPGHKTSLSWKLADAHRLQRGSLARQYSHRKLVFREQSVATPMMMGKTPKENS